MAGGACADSTMPTMPTICATRQVVARHIGLALRCDTLASWRGGENNTRIPAASTCGEIVIDWLSGSAIRHLLAERLGPPRVSLALNSGYDPASYPVFAHTFSCSSTRRAATAMAMSIILPSTV